MPYTYCGNGLFHTNLLTRIPTFVVSVCEPALTSGCSFSVCPLSAYTLFFLYLFFFSFGLLCLSLCLCHHWCSFSLVLILFLCSLSPCVQAVFFVLPPPSRLLCLSFCKPTCPSTRFIMAQKIFTRWDCLNSSPEL